MLNRSLSDISAALDCREIRSRDLAEAVIRAHEVWQPAINALAAFDAEGLFQAAEASDRRRDEGAARGPLDGVPIGYKDMFDRTGRRATTGTRLLDDRIAESDATVISRLQDAGAALAGGLNMAEFAASPSGHNPHFGPVRNPWNPDYTAAGSSGGSGAAVAARMLFGVIGTDTGGSIRLPASVAGVVGVKPTYGRVSRAGLAPRAPSLDTAGPLARTARDCALILDVIAGEDLRDSTTWKTPDPVATSIVGRGPGEVRIGTSRTAPFDILEPAVEGALTEALRVLVKIGGDVSGVCETVLRDLAETYSLADTFSKVEAAALHARFMRERPEGYSKFVYTRTEVGFHLPSQRYYEAQALRGKVLRRFVGSVFAKCDVLVLPVMPIPVPTLTNTADETPEGIRRTLGRMTTFTRPFNYLGLPSVSVPAGADENGMPIGIQLVGRPFAEPLLLALANRYQSETDWFRTAPQPPSR